MRLPPSYKGAEPYVFVSYSHKDSEEVLKDISWMIGKGHRVWYDDGIEFGQDFPTETMRAIKKCKQFIVYLSPNSIESKHVNREINYAVEHDLKICPIILVHMCLSERLDFLQRNLQQFCRFQAQFDSFENGLIEDCNVKLKKVTNPIVTNNDPLLDALATLGIIAELVDKIQGSTITRYELKPISGAIISRKEKIETDLALCLGVKSTIIYPRDDRKSTISIEVPSKSKSIVPIGSLLSADEFKKASSPLTFALGDDVTGKHYFADIAELTHILIGGNSGSGKTTLLYSMIISLMNKTTPDELKLVLIDPKMSAFTQFENLPHLLAPIIVDPHKAVHALQWATKEFDLRYRLFAGSSVRNLIEYNALDTEGQNKLPIIVIMIDEFADLMMVDPEKAEKAVIRILQLGRPAGIYLVIATQRLSSDVITGMNNRNFLSRISFQVHSRIDSRKILNRNGAEKLLGGGDMLYQSPFRYSLIRLQGCFASKTDIEVAMEFACSRFNKPEYNQDLMTNIATNHLNEESDSWDPLLPEAARIGIENGQISITAIQRRFRIGYARAARMIDEMETNHIVSKFDGSKARNVLVTEEPFKEILGHWEL